ncbi:hypothetical protein FRB94_005860 [Tulasnella sp. JGI-2019a]|nr:hypothetical protein FRB94_005860 [Tulasnella sp. JGI-2019a]KAG9007928.1 hypothetical protein FRB93_006947 [Tulasnella sp. JGI-2019a]
MWLADRMLEDEEYKEKILSELRLGFADSLARPVVCQLAGNKLSIMKAAALIVQPYCDAVDINLGCPQTHAKAKKIGAYLLGRADWPLVESMVAGLASVLSIPVHVKIRLCNPAPATPELAVRLARAGASVVALHARHVAAKRRRQGAAKLEWVAEIRKAIEDAGLASQTKVLSNGNVRNYTDCVENLRSTGAAGLMIGEALLGDPT